MEDVAASFDAPDQRVGTGGEFGVGQKSSRGSLFIDQREGKSSPAAEELESSPVGGESLTKPLVEMCSGPREPWDGQVWHTRSRCSQCTAGWTGETLGDLGEMAQKRTAKLGLSQWGEAASRRLLLQPDARPLGPWDGQCGGPEPWGGEGG